MDPTLKISNSRTKRVSKFGEWIDRQHENDSRTIYSLQLWQQAITTISSPYSPMSVNQGCMGYILMV